MRHLLLFLTLALCVPATSAPAATTDAYSDRHPTSAGAGGSPLMDGETFDEGPRRRAAKLPGMGDVRFPITTKNPEAQAFFNQGIAQVHTYYYFEAERSFREVARRDPGCGMAYWGMALANVNNGERASAFLEQAEARRKGMSERERKYLDALSARHKEGGDRHREYVRALEEITLAHPDDVEAKALLAGALVHENPLSRLSVNLLIEQVLQKQPNHPGAHHYRIHLWDGQKPEHALESAKRYAAAAPGIAHAWHMPGHIYNGLGRWREASYQQEASARVDHAHLTRTGLMPFQIHNYAHNQQYLIANLSHVGRVRDAIAFSRNLVETPRDPERNRPTEGWSAQRLGRASLMRIYVRYERWDDLLSDPLLDWSDEPLEQAWKAYSRGLAHLGKGELDRAASEAKALDKIAAAASAAKPPAAGADLMEVARLELRGRLAVADGKLIEGFDLLTKGAGQIGGRDGDLSGYPRPYHEAMGQAHLQAGNWGLAEACFRQVLEKRPNTLVSLAGLVEACACAGKRAETQAAWRDFEAAWPGADADLPLRARLMSVVNQGVRRQASGVSSRSAAAGLQAASSTSPSSPHASRLTPDASLGPRLWSPAPAAPFRLADAAGKWHALDEYKGRSLVVVFYLGGDCEHCMQQLKALGKEKPAIEAMGARVLAVSGDSAAQNQKLSAGRGSDDLPLLLSDRDRAVARRYGAWDEFEERPVHATFLIDPHGKIRWQRISSEPFQDVAFLKSELARVGRLVESAGK